jgi:hypothetical protein
MAMKTGKWELLKTNLELHRRNMYDEWHSIMLSTKKQLDILQEPKLWTSFEDKVHTFKNNLFYLAHQLEDFP